jgi:hypothetical protein
MVQNAMTGYQVALDGEPDMSIRGGDTPVRARALSIIGRDMPIDGRRSMMPGRDRVTAGDNQTIAAGIQEIGGRGRKRFPESC